MKIFFPCIQLFKKLHLPCFRNSAIKSYNNINIYNQVSLLQSSVAQLDTKINSMQEYITKMHSELENRFTIDKYVVESMNVEKFELKVEAINVEEVGGALNVGIIHNSVVYKGRSNQDVNSLNRKHTDICEHGKNKYAMTFYPSGTIPQKKPKTG